MSDDPVKPPIYSDHEVNIYQAESVEEFKRQRRAQWARALAEGSVSPGELAYQLRLRAIEAKQWAMIPCEECGAPGAAHVHVFGSPLGVLHYIEDHLGVQVPGGRHRLIRSHEQWVVQGGMQGGSGRALVFCEQHAPPPSERLVVEPGYMEMFEAVYGVKGDEGEQGEEGR